MTVTTSSANNALKRYYLSAVTDQLKFNTNPFFARIRESSENVVGREVRKLVRFGMNGGVGAGEEDGALPVAHGNNYAVFTQTLKNLFGTIEISDKAIRSSSNSQASFVNLLDDELEGLVRSASYNLSRMLFGNGTARLAKVVSATGKDVTVDDITPFTEGMVVDLYNGDTTVVESGLFVSSVNRAESKITVNKTLSSAENCTLYAGNSKNIEISGLGTLFTAPILYGVSRSTNAWLNPYSKEVTDLTEDEIQLAIDSVEENSGGKVNFIMCSWGVRRALIDLLKANRSVVETIDLEGGYKALSFNGIPVVVDRFCPKGTMYLLNTDDFVLHQLCDWEWLEDEEGKVLRQIPGKAVFSATLVKYAELMCVRPCGQARLTGITEK